MTPARRTASLTLGLPVLAVLFSSAGLVAPATAAPDRPGAPELPTSPFAATIKAKSTKVLTGKKVVLTGTSPTLEAPDNPLPLPELPLPELPLPDSAVPDVAIQVKVGDATDWTDLKQVVPDDDGTFMDVPAQARTTQYRAVPLSPIGSPVAKLLAVLGADGLIASEPVEVDTQGTVTLKQKRAKGTVVYSGRATPGTADQVVTLVTKKGRKVSTLTTTTTAADGSYSVSVPATKGRKAVVAVTTATPDALSASSSRAAKGR